MQRHERRTRIVEYMIKLKADDKDNDLEVWEWFASILGHLGPDGMSSDESSVEGVETVYRVKRLPWRREVAGCMDIIDGQRHKDSDIFATQGTKPIKRVRGTANPQSTRAAVRQLPHPFYDDDWFDGLNANRQSTLDISDEAFEWYNVTTV